MEKVGSLQGRGSTGSASACAGLLLPSLGRWERPGGSARPGKGEQSSAWPGPALHAHGRLLASGATDLSLRSHGWLQWLHWGVEKHI